MQSTTTVVVGVAAVAALLALGACSEATEQAAPSSPSASASAPAQAQAHNSFDVMFAQHMIPHHQQAIEMSNMILGKQGIDPQVTELANQIKDAQGPEIEQMKGWLTDWGMPTAMPSMDMPGHSMPSATETPGDSGGGHGDMPNSGSMPTSSMMPGMSGMPGMGMMSQADMDALENAQGVEASKLYLTQMITHHQGAIDMAQNEAENGENQAVVELANSIIASQQKEIDTMKSILSSL
ncbi:MAG TPA: DUF305 domain-containing protein [Mycobacterium sp.]